MNFNDQLASCFRADRSALRSLGANRAAQIRDAVGFPLRLLADDLPRVLAAEALHDLGRKERARVLQPPQHSCGVWAVRSHTRV